MSARKVHGYVAGMAALAIASLAAVWTQTDGFPGLWGIGVLLLVAFLLQVTATTSRGGDAEGSLSFVIHLAAGVLFGPFWGAIVAGLSTVLSQILLRRPFVKAAFNVAQRTLAVVAGV